MQTAQTRRHLDDQIRQVDLKDTARETWKQLGESSTNHTASTLIKQPGIRVVLLTLEEGALVPEHDTEFAATVQVLSGHVELKLGGEIWQLRPGQLQAIGAGVAHDFKAMVRSEVLLTLGG